MIQNVLMSLSHSVIPFREYLQLFLGQEGNIVQEKTINVHKVHSEYMQFTYKNMKKKKNPTLGLPGMSYVNTSSVYLYYIFLSSEH